MTTTKDGATGAATPADTENKTSSGLFSDNNNTTDAMYVLSFTGGKARTPFKRYNRPGQSPIVYQATRLMALLNKLAVPPSMAEITPDRARVFYGDDFSVVKNIVEAKAAIRPLRDAMADGGVDYVSIINFGTEKYVHVAWGRHGAPEFMAIVLDGREVA